MGFSTLMTVMVVALLVTLMACTAPSKGGVQGVLRATLPVDGVITFE